MSAFDRLRPLTGVRAVIDKARDPIEPCGLSHAINARLALTEVGRHDGDDFLPRGLAGLLVINVVDAQQLEGAWRKAALRFRFGKRRPRTVIGAAACRDKKARSQQQDSQPNYSSPISTPVG